MSSAVSARPRNPGSKGRSVEKPRTSRSVKAAAPKRSARRRVGMGRQQGRCAGIVGAGQRVGKLHRIPQGEVETLAGHGVQGLRRIAQPHHAIAHRLAAHLQA